MSAAVSYRLPGWRNKLALDVSRLVRSFAADPDAQPDDEDDYDSGWLEAELGEKLSQSTWRHSM